MFLKCSISEMMAFSEGAIRNNAMVVEYCRTSMGNIIFYNSVASVLISE
jgi:hypothetical protein